MTFIHPPCGHGRSSKNWQRFAGHKKNGFAFLVIFYFGPYQEAFFKNYYFGPYQEFFLNIYIYIYLFLGFLSKSKKKYLNSRWGTFKQPFTGRNRASEEVIAA